VHLGGLVLFPYGLRETGLQQWFSTPWAELGLLVAQAGWKRAGAEWVSARSRNAQRVEIRLPLASESNHPASSNPQSSNLRSENLIGIIRLRFPGIQVVLLDSEKPQTLQDEAAMNSCEAAAQGLASEEAARPSPARPQSAPLPGMIGTSEAMQRVYRMVRLVAPRMTTALVAGPTGSGKELVACGLHVLSPRAAKCFVVVNCAAIPETLLESELFGYTRGASLGR
jgi:transcriptional regulator of acetoin/glycerol metabolism